MICIRLSVTMILLPLVTSCVVEYAVPLPTGFYSLGDNPRYKAVIGQTVPTQRETKLYLTPTYSETSHLVSIGARQFTFQDGQEIEVPHRIIPAGMLVTVRDVRSGYGAPYERCIVAYLTIQLPTHRRLRLVFV